MIKVAIVGGTGYTGVELLRILALHPEVEVIAVTSRADTGKKIAAIYPNLYGLYAGEFCSPELDHLIQADVVFFATPNGTAMQMAPALLAAGIKVIDLSADFRLKNPQQWEQWYGMTHVCPELISQAIYGLVEMNRSLIREAQLIACAGCYPTAVQLGLLPLIENHLLIHDQIIADVKSGVSGAGRKAELAILMSETGESFKAYSVNGHRHLPEIQQNLSLIANREIKLTFVPHLTPMIRGIHATLYVQTSVTIHELQTVFEQRYANETFVTVLPLESHPDTRNVRGSNQCQIALHQPQGGDITVILVVIDNLVKGAAGQAVQIMNLLYNIEETVGLKTLALYP